MDNITRNALSRLNQIFYSNISVSFDKSRKKSWGTWEKLQNIIEGWFIRNKKLEVLDLGCGNGRFLDFLNRKFVNDIEYEGIDLDTPLFINAKNLKLNNHINASFNALDILEYLKIKKKYKVIVLFGIMHHIPGRVFRKELLLHLGSRLYKNGLIIYSTWDFLEYGRFKKLIIDTKLSLKISYSLTGISIKKSKLEKNDYFLSWDKNDKYLRYCHYFDENEKKYLISSLKEAGYALVSRIKGTGSNDRYNEYFIIRNLRPI